jgi:hypothetical protein
MPRDSFIFSPDPADFPDGAAGDILRDGGELVFGELGRNDYN